MNAPAFSTFSAVSELLVTAVVLWVILSNLGGRSFRWKPLGIVLAFETCVNIVYMVKRAAEADTHGNLTQGMTVMLAVHGIMALVMFVGLLLVYVVATFDHKAGRPTWFQSHRVLTWAFVVAWIATVGMGEYAYFWRYW